jgi:hypothetical protein
MFVHNIRDHFMKNLIPIMAGIPHLASFTESTHRQNISISALVASILNDSYQPGYSDLIAEWTTRQNTVETDPASSQTQVVNKKAVATGNRLPLFLAPGDKTILQSMGAALGGVKISFWQAQKNSTRKNRMYTQSGG